MGNRTFVPIASTTLGSDAASVTFSDIPQTYRDLVVVAQLGSATAGATLRLRVNGDTGSNYSYTVLAGSGSAASSARLSSQTSGAVAFHTQGLSAAVDNVVVAEFLSYANTNVYKTVLGSGASPGREVDRMVCLWRSTAAITSIALAAGGSFPTYNTLAGSQFTLYGIGE